ncbi:hypothetical protein CFter6_1805 [Collimonas fungivorans]|uniref:Uncharacterized protein n=1 Tax=Collimonas fungivorans TaxID=158899 RepID=A0A127P9T5_9BURK|nr:hypothetical protein CFter6_1805 [Collimonas fungivorans]
MSGGAALASPDTAGAESMLLASAPLLFYSKKYTRQTAKILIYQ